MPPDLDPPKTTIAHAAGGHATEHMANERTFLAWVRTSQALVGVGFLVAKLGLFLAQHFTPGESKTPLPVKGSHELVITGVLFLLLGTTVCAGSGWLYHRTRKLIDDALYEPPTWTITALTVIVVLGGLTITGILLWQVAIPDKV